MKQLEVQAHRLINNVLTTSVDPEEVTLKLYPSEIVVWAPETDYPEYPQFETTITTRDNVMYIVNSDDASFSERMLDAANADSD